MRVYHDFVLVPGSRSTFPDADPYPDPAKWYGSDRIRIQIRNTATLGPIMDPTYFSECFFIKIYLTRMIFVV